MSPSQGIMGSRQVRSLSQTWIRCRPPVRPFCTLSAIVCFPSLAERSTQVRSRNVVPNVCDVLKSSYLVHSCVTVVGDATSQAEVMPTKKS